MTTPGQGAPDGAFAIGTRFGQDLTKESAKAIMRGVVIGSFEGAQATAHATYNDVINDHSRSIAEMREVIERVILQGVAIVYEANETYTPHPDVTAIDVILIGAGAGGSSGSQDAFGVGTRAGGGGGGGGETHVTVPSSLLLKNDDGTFKGIQIVIGMGGAGAASDANVGQGGGHTLFGPEVGSAEPAWLMAGGGTGGVWGNTANQAPGGVGMIPGGFGGSGGGPGGGSTAGGPSTSAYDLHGGGGGGGGGGALGRSAGRVGGGGGIAPGGAPANPGLPGHPPSTIVATGGGGGGGGLSGSSGGGSGAFPAGGGGGSACDGTGATFGGNGGDGIVYIIERMS